jgi:hypothetical protein
MLITIGKSSGSWGDITFGCDVESWATHWIWDIFYSWHYLELCRICGATFCFLDPSSNIRVWCVTWAGSYASDAECCPLLAGLLLYSELASMFPNRSGAEVVYLEQAYPRPRFLVPIAFAVTSVLLSFVLLSLSNSFSKFVKSLQFQCHELDCICPIRVGCRWYTYHSFQSNWSCHWSLHVRCSRYRPVPTVTIMIHDLMHSRSCGLIHKMVT